jgi:L-asparaginase/Glu-tRNA(Gln) amidotransferase subunit D
MRITLPVANRVSFDMSGVIQAFDMSTECIVTKLMWALKRAATYEEIQELMHTDYTGELNKDRKLY